MSSSIYHCGHCGSLFSAEFGREESRVCAVCKQMPGTGERPAGPGGEGMEGWGTRLHSNARDPSGLPEGKAHRGAIKRKKGTLLSWLVILWGLLLGTSLWLHRHHSKLDGAAEYALNKEAAMEQGKAEMLENALPLCHEVLSGFLDASTLEERSKFVFDAPETIVKMADFYGSEPFPKVEGNRVGRIGQEILKLDGDWVVRTRWQGGGVGERFDAVFLRKSGAWVLDWEHFARFNMHRWESFLAGEGPEESAFRLLAVEIPGEDGTGRELRFGLLPPDAAGHPGRQADLREFSVGRLSEDGLLLGAAFAAKRDGSGPFGGVMKSMEPEGMIRVRIAVNRSDFAGMREFEIAKVVACHWMSSDEPGFDIGELKERAFSPGR